MGFSRQEDWSGVPLPYLIQMLVSFKDTLRDPMDCSLPDSSIHGIFQARVLEWGAIAFSNKSIILQHKNNDEGNCVFKSIQELSVLSAHFFINLKLFQKVNSTNEKGK